jgi:hypothetical protein
MRSSFALLGAEMGLQPFAAGAIDWHPTLGVTSGADAQPEKAKNVTSTSTSRCLMRGLTPELSRPAAGRRTRASVAYARGCCHDAGSA